MKIVSNQNISSSNNALLPIVYFLQGVIGHLELQAGQNTATFGTHPDTSIKNFNSGLLIYLQQGADFSFLKLISNVFKKRNNEMEPSHFVDLIARAVQYIHRLENNENYLNFSPNDWLDYFENLDDPTVLKLESILSIKQVATHIVSRYRGLGAILNIVHQKINKPLVVADVGCSLNLGLGLALQPEMLLDKTSPAFEEDQTPNEAIKKLLKTSLVDCEYAVGIDIQIPDLNWVAACSYFSQYNDHKDLLSKTIYQLKSCPTPIFSIVGDVTEENFQNLVQTRNKRKPDVIHAAMSLYQLSEDKKIIAKKNIANALTDNGIFVELCFSNINNWFDQWNVISTLSFKLENGQLSEPLNWLEWDSSRCRKVRPGKDFQACLSLLSQPNIGNNINQKEYKLA